MGGFQFNVVYVPFQDPSTVGRFRNVLTSYNSMAERVTKKLLLATGVVP
jgi:hypothetical protein